MVMIHLSKVHIHLLSTGEGVAAYSSDRSSTQGIDGKVQVYANGRQRAIIMTGTKSQYNCTLRDVSDEDVTTVERFMGKPVCVRDNKGQRFFGIYFDVARNERRTLGYWDIPLQIVSITYNEGG